MFKIGVLVVYMTWIESYDDEDHGRIFRVMDSGKFQTMVHGVNNRDRGFSAPNNCFVEFIPNKLEKLIYNLSDISD